MKDWLSASALASLYANCDIFMALHRGGAFELHCLEALSYGLPVLAPGHGAVLDYLNNDNASLISVKPGGRLHAAGNDHSGRAFQCELPDIAKKLHLVVANLDLFTQRAQREKEPVRKFFTWERSARAIVDFTI